MKSLEEKLNRLKEEGKNRKIKIMILGLGSVGNYLLDYLMSAKDEGLEFIVAGRNAEKMQSDVNIIRVSSMIRRQNRSGVKIEGNVDFNDVEAIRDCIKRNQPDMIVNASRAYSGLKYGSISWVNLRAYGIWSPLAIKFIKNIMEAYEEAESNAVVINTSYSDVVIPWLKSAGKVYPDFGSGNLNHLLPRMKFAVAQQYQITNAWDIDITYAAAHFHDVVISKEGHDEGVEQLIHFEYEGRGLKPDLTAVLSKCRIAMPVDAKRNMMNASSNFEIIQAILAVIRGREKVKLHCPGVFGEIGGYPVILDSTDGTVKAYIDERYFTLEQMRLKNRESIYLDGIKEVAGGTLYYSPELIQKVKAAFDADLPAEVKFEEIDKTAQFLIKEIIEPALKDRKQTEVRK